jgi:hypothetical protein
MKLFDCLGYYSSIIKRSSGIPALKSLDNTIAALAIYTKLETKIWRITVLAFSPVFEFPSFRNILQEFSFSPRHRTETSSRTHYGGKGYTV